MAGHCSCSSNNRGSDSKCLVALHKLYGRAIRSRITTSPIKQHPLLWESISFSGTANKVPLFTRSQASAYLTSTSITLLHAKGMFA